MSESRLVLEGEMKVLYCDHPEDIVKIGKDTLAGAVRRAFGNGEWRGWNSFYSGAYRVTIELIGADWGDE